MLHMALSWLTLFSSATYHSRRIMKKWVENIEKHYFSVSHRSNITVIQMNLSLLHQYTWVIHYHSLTHDMNTYTNTTWCHLLCLAAFVPCPCLRRALWSSLSYFSSLFPLSACTLTFLQLRVLVYDITDAALECDGDVLGFCFFFSYSSVPAQDHSLMYAHSLGTQRVGLADVSHCRAALLVKLTKDFGEVIFF